MYDAHGTLYIILECVYYYYYYRYYPVFYSYDSYSVIIGIGILYYHPITEYNIQKKKMFQTVQTY